MSSPSGQETVLSSFPYLLLENQKEELSFCLREDVYYLGRDRAWAVNPRQMLLIPDRWTVVSGHHAILRRDGKSYRIWDGDGQKQSANGLWANHRRIGMEREGYLLQDGIELEIGQNPSNAIRVTYIQSSLGRPTVKPSKRQLVLRGLTKFPVLLGREESEEYSYLQIDAPTVSRRHALISPAPQGGYVIEDCSTNGTFVNGQRIPKLVTLREGDKVQIGPFILLFRQETLEICDQGDRIRLDAHHLFRIIRNPKKGDKILLNNISLAIEPGQLVALVGGSGTGKSTLLKTLLGIVPIDKGTVSINGDNLNHHFDSYRTHIGYVPQDDIVHTDLTVEEVLGYACQLRLPPETSVRSAIDRILKQVQLEFVRNNYVRELSGGQRKRVSIGVELLADPKLLFLDEPTSGLDPGLDLEMMELLRELADRGRTIVLVTHATANIEKCDRVAFLGVGGNLCYFGPPIEAMDFFEMPSQDWKYFAQIYRKLNAGSTPQANLDTVRHWREKFQAPSLAYQKYVTAVLGADPAQQSAANSSSSVRSQGFNWQKQLTAALKQWQVLSQRYSRLVWRDRLSLILGLATAPAVIILLACLVDTSLAKVEPLETAQAPSVLKVLFIFTCAGIFVGLLSSVQEIVKEATIYLRERLVNLGILTYLGSKLAIRTGIAIAQTLLMVIAILLGFTGADSSLMPWSIGLGITTFLTIWASICLGLMVSAWVKNETTANNSLSLLFLPQIILSGVLFKLNGWSSQLSWLTISRWSVGAYGTLVDVNAMVPEAMQTPLGEVERPFEPTPMYEPTWHNLSLNWAILGLQGLIYLAITVWLQKRKDKLGKNRKL